MTTIPRDDRQTFNATTIRPVFAAARQEGESSIDYLRRRAAEVAEDWCRFARPYDERKFMDVTAELAVLTSESVDSLRDKFMRNARARVGNDAAVLAAAPADGVKAAAERGDREEDEPNGVRLRDARGKFTSIPRDDRDTRTPGVEERPLKLGTHGWGGMDRLGYHADVFNMAKDAGMVGGLSDGDRKAIVERCWREGKSVLECVEMIMAAPAA